VVTWLQIWSSVLKIVARIAARLGKSAPCPASLAWLVNNPLRRVLRPDGILSITAEFTDPDYLFARETLRLLEQNGFKLVEKHGNWWRYTMNFRPAEGQELVGSYYVARQDSLLREYDGAVQRIRPMLVQRYGEPFVRIVAADARAEFQRLIPQLPFIGGRRNPLLTFFLVSTGWYLAFYRAMQKQGKDINELGPLILDIYQSWMDSYPAWVLHLAGWLAFTPITRRRLERNSKISQLRRYPGDWLFSFVPKNGHDFGVDYTECGIYKFCQEQNATELMPYLCSVDFIMSERMNLGLQRTMTLAEGSQKCDFRFKHRRPTIWPPGLQEKVKSSLSADTVALLRQPGTREPLRYEATVTKDGHFQEWLVADESNDGY
jgi:hypothetical protein